MIDSAYIDELRQLEAKEAKDKLAEYAATFGITVKKSRSFENIVLDITEKLNELANAPLPENNEGLTITDLIQAADEKDGKTFTEESEAPKEAIDAVNGLLSDSLGNSVEDIKQSVNEAIANDDNLESIDETPTDIVVSPEPALANIKLPDLFELPEKFSPTLGILGRNPGYCTLPWWIFEWIKNNPDWKQKPNSFPHHYGIDTLYSLIYYIKRDGSVMIRETRNSSFHTLT